MLENIIFYILICFGGLTLGYLLGLIKYKDILLGPNSKNIYEQTFKKDDKCYKLIPSLDKCSILDKHI
jgi:hypothetical protein